MPPATLEALHKALSVDGASTPLTDAARRVCRLQNPRQVIDEMDDVLLCDWISWNN